MRGVRGQIAGLPRRAWLTLRHLGLREFGRRALMFPLRLLPTRQRYWLAERTEESRKATAWYAQHAQRVLVVIPTYGDPGLAIDAVRSIRATTRADRVRIVVADDGSAAEHLERLRRVRGIELVEGGEQRGFAANCNRGIALREPDEDLVLFNSDVVAYQAWLEGLQYTAYQATMGIVGPKLLYADGTIQSAGSVRNAGAPEWFDHRYRFRASSYPPANLLGLCLAVTGALMYVRRDCLEAIGGTFDEAYGMAFEDTDWCLRAWDAGWRVGYCPFSVLTHLESKTRGMVQGDRELASQRLFWERWGAWLDEREVAAPDGRLRVIYVTENTGVGGGHRVAFQHLAALRDAGHHPELWTRDDSEPPDWFDLGGIPVRGFGGDYHALQAALEPEHAMKVATWWNTAEHVWPAALRNGIPAYFVQDIETSYYDHEPAIHGRVLDSYRLEFRYVTTSGWNADRLRDMHISPTVISPGIDEHRFHVRDDVERREGVVLAAGRSEPLKHFALTRGGWEHISEHERPELWLYGIEPELADGPGIQHFRRPSDEELNRLLNEATVFVQTSRHEGFCLTILEAMAAGAPVVCTDADGNRDFCRDGENCLLVESTPEAVAAGIRRLLGDAGLRERLRAGGLDTARQYRWSARAPELVRFYESLAPAGARAGG